MRLTRRAAALSFEDISFGSCAYVAEGIRSEMS
jgi:hypothetical protein